MIFEKKEVRKNALQYNCVKDGLALKAEKFSVAEVSDEPDEVQVAADEGSTIGPYSGAVLISAACFLLIEMSRATNTMRGADGRTAVRAYCPLASGWAA